MIQLQAHRGVGTEYPENTMPAIEAAVAQGYSVIELDVSVTKDLRFVLLHDRTLNRTARYPDGSSLEEPVEIGDISYDQAQEYDFGIWFSKDFQGAPIPLFDDVLTYAQSTGVKLKLDNKYQAFTPEQKQAFFQLLKPFEDTAQLTCKDLDAAGEAAAHFPRMHIHYDGPVSEEILKSLSAILPKERLTVWLPMKNKHTAWVKVPFADQSLAELVKGYARLGLWLLSDTSHLAEAEALGAEIAETNGQLKPIKNCSHSRPGQG